MTHIDDIVAVKIGSKITNDLKVIEAALAAHRRDFDPITRIRARFMAACDVGEHWTRIANAPTLWREDENGKPQP